MSATTMPIAATAEKAGWWTRALAIIIDALGIGIVAGAVSGMAGNPVASSQHQGLTILLQAAYFTYFWSAAGKGQTIGSRALNIRVVKADGAHLDYVGAFLRFVGWVISGAIFLLGFIWAAFDARNQGWHDKIAGTYVVKA